MPKEKVHHDVYCLSYVMSPLTINQIKKNLHVNLN